MKQHKATYQQITPSKSNGAKKTNGHSLTNGHSTKELTGLLSELSHAEEHAQMAISTDKRIPEDIRKFFAESDQYFPTDLQKFQYFDKYSRFNYDLGRRETWIETVDRSVNFLRELSQNKLPDSVYQRIRTFVLEMKATPSMRLLAMAGPAARRNNICIYNCSYIPVDSIDSWVEGLIISMSGCGVGFSVEKKYISKLPIVKSQTFKPRQTYIIDDSTEGWADAVRTAFTSWFNGEDLTLDYSQLRPAGAPLKIKGGRASGPDPLRKLMEFTRARILNAQGRQITPLEAHDIMCEVGNAAVSGGVRRTALISLFDWDDEEMRTCKHGDFEKENSQRWNANNSAVWPENIKDTDIMKQMVEMVESGDGEPGIFSRDTANRLRPARRQSADFGTNPCVTGDTWVAVADGRGRARMIDLAKVGKDIDVFTVKDGKLVIRTMRNPRKTGTKVPIYKVKFADGTSIKVTANHKFVLTDGTQKQAVDLELNDALLSMSTYSYLKRGLPKTMKASYDSEGSYRMLQFGHELRKSEHRFLYAHYKGVNLVGTDYHLHHKDFDGRNNHLDNLLYLSTFEHAQYHRVRMLGKNNPVHKMNDNWRTHLSEAVKGLKNGNAKAFTNEQIEKILVEFIKSLGHRPLKSEYQKFAVENDLPLYFSAFRKNYFGGNITSTLIQLSEQLKVMEPWEAHAREFTDLPLHFNNGQTYVTRLCEGCGVTLELQLNRREQSFCKSCSQKVYYQRFGSKIKSEAIREARTRNHNQIKERQMKLYNDLMFFLGRHPSKKEWQTRCQEAGISPEISRKSSPFRYWNDLETAALGYNHRVISVEIDGEEDVYTGTVDDTHTFFGIGNERIDKRGRAEMAYVLNVQCGEISLRPYEFCNLTISIARSDDTPETLKEKVEVASIIGTIQSMATYFPGLRETWKHNGEEERLLGVDITGQLDCPAVQDPKVMEMLKTTAVETNKLYAQILGIKQSVSVTCVKPSGNSSQLFNCSSGLHARWSPFYIRNVRVSAHSPIFKVLKDAGAPMDPENGQTAENANTWVVHFPVKSPPGAVFRGNRGATEQCEYWLMNKQHWTEHNPSVTITYKPNEVMDLIKWVVEHKDYIAGMSFLPSFDAKYDQLPYIEITEEEYNHLAFLFPKIDFSKLFLYESEDLTTASTELACVSGACEVDYDPIASGISVNAAA